MSYSFTDGHQTLTQDNSTGGFSVGFNYTTSAPLMPGGVGTGVGGWWMADMRTLTSGISTFFGGDYQTTSWIGGAQPSSYHYCGGPTLCYDDLSVSTANISGLAGGTRGTWTMDRVAMPEAGGTALFLFTNLAGLAILALFVGLKRVKRGL